MSRVFEIGVLDNKIVNCVAILSWEAGFFPFTYLGVSVGSNMNLKRNLKASIGHVHNRLSSWESKSLSFGGWLTLVKSVLRSLPYYYFSLFKVRMCVINDIERIHICFLWGGNNEKSKICWVNWQTVLTSKEIRGIGVGSLKSIDLALLFKWIWWFKYENYGLWHKVICNIHNLTRKTVNKLAKVSFPSIYSKFWRFMGLTYHLVKIWKAK